MHSPSKILLVDDDESIVEFVQMALEDEGYETLSASHGRAALEILRQLTPRLILLDMRMPLMNGWEFARAYRESAGCCAPIIVLTAGDAAETAAQIGAQGYLSKPFTVEALVEVVHRFAA